MWIVSGDKDDMVQLVSSKKIDGILPIGAYLTIEDENGVKHILRVENSIQKSLFEPSPLVVDEGLPLLSQDQECKNIVLAQEIAQFPVREDGLYSFIKPNAKARRTNQEEINQIFQNHDGYCLFIATSFRHQNAILQDDQNRYLYFKVPIETLYQQTMICGQTGSGKTVGMKYIITQFLEKEPNGAVLAINVKGEDLLLLNKKTEIKGDPNLMKECEKEWKTIGLEARGVQNSAIYVPYARGRTRPDTYHITLKTADLEPNALLGILQNISDRGAEALPNIFRYWKRKDSHEDKTFRSFLKWFKDKASKENKYSFPTLSQNEEEGETSLHQATYEAIKRSLESAIDYFDSRGDCIPLSDEQIMQKNKLSVIDLSDSQTKIFGSILLRHLLNKIYSAKSYEQKYRDIPILIVIDEVHNFYGHNTSKNALQELNLISRMGREYKMGVVFASQNPQDLPKGITSIVNTRIFFRSLSSLPKLFGISDSNINLSTLESGYALFSCYAFPQIKLVKFPMSPAGVFK